MADMLSEGALEQKATRPNSAGMGLVNPVIRKMQRAEEQASSGERVATYGGIATKTGFFLIITLVAIGGYFALQPLFEKSGNIIETTSGIIAIQTTPMGLLWLIGAVLLTIIMPLLCWLCKSIIPVIGTVYCVAQGYLVGFIADSLVPEFKWLAILSLALTIGLVGGMLFLYAKRIVKVGKKTRSVIITAFVAIFLGSVLLFVMNFIPGLNQIAAAISKLLANPIVGVIVSCVFVVIGALMLLVDFDAIEQCVENNLPKKREWMAAFGLAYTIIYLYLKILDILMKLFGRRRS